MESVELYCELATQAHTYSWDNYVIWRRDRSVLSILNFPLSHPRERRQLGVCNPQLWSMWGPSRVGRLLTECPWTKNSVSFFFFLLEISKEASKTSGRKRPTQHEEPHKVRMGHCGSQDAASGDPQSEQPGCSKPDFHCPKEPFGYFFSHHNLLMIA